MNERKFTKKGRKSFVFSLKKLPLLSIYYIKNKNVMQELVNKINEQISVFQENAKSQAENNNKAAGGRARKASLELEKLLKEFRKVSIAASK